jgi:uncharacterized protein YcnI
MTFSITRRTGTVLATSLATTLAGVLAFATPAFAHTQITLDPAQAGAPSATMKVNAEAENEAAGIQSVQIFMPEGIDPAKITLAAGPEGWTLQAGPDNVTVSGVPLPEKTDAAFSLTFGPLPATASVLTFKTLVNYADGKIDRWIGAPGSSNPAPTVSLAAANAAPTTGAAIRSDGAAVDTAPAPGPASSNTAVWWIVGIVVVALAGAGLWVAARRRNAA